LRCCGHKKSIFRRSGGAMSCYRKPLRQGVQNRHLRILSKSRLLSGIRRAPGGTDPRPQSNCDSKNGCASSQKNKSVTIISTIVLLLHHSEVISHAASLVKPSQSFVDNENIRMLTILVAASNSINSIMLQLMHMTRNVENQKQSRK
jgi:hypothetical protein